MCNTTVCVLCLNEIRTPRLHVCKACDIFLLLYGITASGYFSVLGCDRRYTGDCFGHGCILNGEKWHIA